MKLRMVEVSNFRSIDKSNEFSVGETTCLVGKNESGKTTLLQALECRHPYEATRNKYNKLRDYDSDIRPLHAGKLADPKSRDTGWQGQGSN
jgi:predicted ATP-dependent endonuclease of OLD family